MTGGRDIGHDERLSDVLDATVDTSVSCTPSPSYPVKSCKKLAYIQWLKPLGLGTLVPEQFPEPPPWNREAHRRL